MKRRHVANSLPSSTARPMRHGQEQYSHHSRTSPLSFQGTRRPHNLINRMEMVTSTTRNLSTAVKEVMYGTCSRMGDGDGGQRPEGVAMDQNPPAMFVADAPGLDFLNSIATPVDTPVDWIVAGPRGEKAPLRFQKVRRWRTPDALLSPIGEALAQFVCTEDFSNVKACEGPVCTLLFADHTRGRARRWCSMALCGNRAKQAAHRHRLKAQQH